MKPRANPFLRSAALTASMVLSFGTAAHAANFEQSGDNYNLSFTAIPEPSSALLGGLATLLLLRRRRTLHR